MLTLILGNQLFSEFYGGGQCLMIEDVGIATTYRYHKSRILHQFVSMREFRDEISAAGIPVDYFKFEESIKVAFYDRIARTLKKHGLTSLQTAEIADVAFKNNLKAWAEKNKIKLTFLPSPQFMVSEAYFSSYLKKYKKPFMKNFYEGVRKEHQILVTQDLSPVGGQWSFDAENRKKLPKAVQVPPMRQYRASKHTAEVIELVSKHFSDHPGDLNPDQQWLPSCRKDALDFLRHFLKSKFHQFGPYEDAIDPRDDFLFHSGLSPLMNIGFLNPGEVVDHAIQFAKKNKVPMESLEGFVRQIIGWREFIRGIHTNFHEEQGSRNFFKHTRKMKSCWYDGTTGLPPVDDAIKKAVKLAYNHHIERLMILSNVMLLTELKPVEVHQWFMEMYLDSYEWVMGPNVYGMGQFSDGGIFATKPYLSGSNYILKMSSYPKGEWCDVRDGLYWSFIHNHLDFFSKNPRLSMMASMLSKMDPKRKDRLLNLADNFKDAVSLR